jgi:probable rRNA maturation factor
MGGPACDPAEAGLTVHVTLALAGELDADQRAIVRSARLGPLLRRCGTELGVAPDVSLSVRLTGDRELKHLNAAFLDMEAPTDVLAFPALEPGYLGDIAISVERAVAQAVDGAAELRLLAVHGLLHCLGHDHHDVKGAAVMTAVTRKLLPGQDVPALTPAARAGAG